MEIKSRPTLGQSGPLTGLQLFTKINCLLALLGQDPVDAPPASPTFGELAPQNVVISNTGGVIAVKLTCPTSPGHNTLLCATALQHSGIRRTQNYRVLGMCPTPAQGSADITSLYVAAFGALTAGKCLFVQASLVVDGWESIPRTFSGLVPASA